MRWFIANTTPQAMMFGVSDGKKPRVIQASPQMQFAKGWPLTRLRGSMKMRRIGFFEVVRNA